jgi:hypothetical protein
MLLLASGALAGFTGLLAVDALDLNGEPAAVLVGSMVATHSGAATPAGRAPDR